VHNGFLDYLSKDDNLITNLEEDSTVVPPTALQDVTARLSFIFIGVNNTKMNEDEVKEFAVVTEEYYRTQLLTVEETDNKTLVALQSVEVVGQSLSNNGAESTKLRHRYLEVGDDDYALTVDVEFHGRYMPPPEIDFGAVVVEVFEDDSTDGQEYIEHIREAPIEYFDDFDGDVVIEKQDTAPMPLSSSTEEESEFGGILGKNGVMAITIVLWSIAWSSLCYMLWIKFYSTSMERNKSKWRQSSRPDNSELSDSS